MYELTRSHLLHLRDDVRTREALARSLFVRVTIHVRHATISVSRELPDGSPGS